MSPTAVALRSETMDLETPLLQSESALVDPLMQKVRAALEKQFKAELRV